MLGHDYTASGFITAGYNGGTGYDLVLLAAAAAVPLYLKRIVLTAVTSAQPILPIEVVRRSSASTGGAAVVPTPDSPTSPSASTAVSSLCTTSTGAISGIPIDSQDWQQFGPYVYDKRPDGIIIAPGTWVALFMPTPVNANIAMGFRIEFTEVK